MASYTPNIVTPGADDDTPGLDSIIAELKQGCPGHAHVLAHAEEVADYYEGRMEKYIPSRPAEDALSWLTRPKRVSFITAQAVDKLTSHLYKPGPRRRKVVADEAIDAWYSRVAKDIQLNTVMQQADRLATLHGICAIGVYPTGDPSRPINYHLFPRQDFLFWTSPVDPRVAVAVCTINKVNADTLRYRLWTYTHYYTFFKGKTWGYTPGGWNVARFVPEQSGEHPYGVLPFTFITHELPTTELATPGLGPKIVRVNRALNIDKSNLALWVHHYGRPLGFVSGVGPEWKPKFIEGGFVPLVVKAESNAEAPVIPDVRYLESSLDIAAVQAWMLGEANQALAEINVPLTVTIQSDGGGGAMARSGIGIAAIDKDVITYTKGRQPLFDLHEARLCSLICWVAASNTGSGAPQESLRSVAIDPNLRVAWPEPSIDLPGPDRDAADQFELDYGLTDAIELLMRRQGLTEDEAIEQYRAIQRRKVVAATLQADPEADIAALMPAEAQPALPEPEKDPFSGIVAADMGIEVDGDGTGTGNSNGVGYAAGELTNVALPGTPLPAGPVYNLGAGGGYGRSGTEQ